VQSSHRGGSGALMVSKVLEKYGKDHIKDERGEGGQQRWK
jgi:hypothetical protein